MKIKVSSIFVLVLVCNFLILNAVIIREEDQNIISHLNTNDNTKVTFNRDTKEYTISKKADSENAYENFSKDCLNSLAKKEFDKYENELENLYKPQEESIE